MKFGNLRFSITLLFITIIHSVCSQENTYARDQLNMALKDYQIKYNDLLEDRGISDITDNIGDNYISRI